MEKNRQHLRIRISMVITVFIVGLLVVSYRPAIAASSMRAAQGLVDRAR